jgi:hypothetical protein
MTRLTDFSLEANGLQLSDIVSDYRWRKKDPWRQVMKILSLVSFVFSALILSAAQAIAATTPPKGAVLTWHDDNFRTGWQQQETILTTSTVSKLGILHEVPLKDQVDAQPLVIPSFINGHDIAFVADESNNVYQIDANTGAILKQVNLGPPVPFPFGCPNNGPNVGINSTPVIDWAGQTLFVMVYRNVNGAPTYFLHALDLVTLADKGNSPFEVIASHTLTNGASFAFNATNLRQRAALLFANNEGGGYVYAAFTSFCDFPARGWLLGFGWTGAALSAFGANQLDDRQASSPTSFFLDTIWMSGAGPAMDEAANLIFSTGNSDDSKATKSTWTGMTGTAPCSGTATGTVPTSVPCSNIQESVVKLNVHLTEITGLFSPNNQFGTFSPDTLGMDQVDGDLGSGGVLLAPPRGNAYLAATAGKDGRLFLFDRSGTGLKLLQLRQGLGCWCAPSYFTGPDGVGRIVASQGSAVQTFQIPTMSLSPEGTSTISSSGQDPGFFTTVSCDGSGAFGNCTNTPIIWAVSRPLSTSFPGVYLHAFSGSAVNGSYPLLFGPTRVGSWPSIGANANIVPTVANGLVYVASNKLLTILKEGAVAAAALPVAEAAAATPPEAAAPLTTGFAISGTLRAVNGSTLTLTNRNGKDRLIDASEAIANGLVAPALTAGKAYTAVGSSFTSAGELHADAIYRAKCRQHSDAGQHLTGAQPTCTGDQWPLDKDPGQ